MKGVVYVERDPYDVLVASVSPSGVVHALRTGFQHAPNFERLLAQTGYQNVLP